MLGLNWLRLDYGLEDNTHKKRDKNFEINLFKKYTRIFQKNKNSDSPHLLDYSPGTGEN